MYNEQKLLLAIFMAVGCSTQADIEGYESGSNVHAAEADAGDGDDDNETDGHALLAGTKEDVGKVDNVTKLLDEADATALTVTLEAQTCIDGAGLTSLGETFKAVAADYKDTMQRARDMSDQVREGHAAVGLALRRDNDTAAEVAAEEVEDHARRAFVYANLASQAKLKLDLIKQYACNANQDHVRAQEQEMQTKNDIAKLEAATAVEVAKIEARATTEAAKTQAAADQAMAAEAARVEIAQTNATMVQAAATNRAVDQARYETDMQAVQADRDRCAQYPGTAGCPLVYGPRTNGCFAGDTPITLSDGRTLRADHLQPGHRVRNPLTGAVLRVQEVVAGPELIAMVEIVAGGHTVVVTEKHPMLTQGGVKAARDLTPNDELRMATGGYARVVAVSRPAVRPGQMVYNFRLETLSPDDRDAMVDAGGLVTGDLAVQERLETSLLPERNLGMAFLPPR